MKSASTKVKIMKAILTTLLLLGIVDIVNGEEFLTKSSNAHYPVYTEAHVQNMGWQKKVPEGKISGTVGKGLRLEGIKLSADSYDSYDINYQVHVQDYGWMDWKKNGEMAGTVGQGKRLEAISIELTGGKKNASHNFDVYYRVHAQNFGWLGWAKNGEEAGTAGFGYRLEGMEVRIVKKNSGNAPSTSKEPFVENLLQTANKQKPVISYSTHIQNIGWQNYQQNGSMSGTEGRSLRLEGIKIKLSNLPVAGGVKYKTHVQNIGWQDFVHNNQVSGTSKKALRLEAIQIELTGEMAKKYDVFYRVHAQNFGWLGWTRNGGNAGTAGYGFRLEGIEVKLVEKGKQGPAMNKIAFEELQNNRKVPMEIYYVKKAADGKTEEGIEVETIEAIEGTRVSIRGKQIPGYTLKGEERQDIVVYENRKIIFEYVKHSKKIEIRVLHQGSNGTILADETVEVDSGEYINVEAQEFDGYQLKGDKEQTVVAQEDEDIVFYYKKLTSNGIDVEKESSVGEERMEQEN